MKLAELGYAVRSFARTPGLTVVLLLTLALGIGANASVFGFIRGSIARNLPFSAAGEIVSVFERDADGQLGPTSYARYSSIKQHEALGLLGAARESQHTVRVRDRTSILTIAAVTSELADLLKLPLRGGVVISHRTWRTEFRAKARLAAERIRIDSTEVGVAGVAPEWLEGLYSGRAVDIWMPLEDAALQKLDRRSRSFWVVGLLAPGIPRRTAQTDANATNDEAGELVVLPYNGMTPEAAGGIALVATLLPAAAGAVFLIACANVAGFLLSRVSARTRERSVCVALGATERHLAAQLFIESVLVSAAGAALAVVLAFWAAQVIPALLFIEDAERLTFAPDARGILLVSSMCAAIIVACGLVPLIEMRHDHPASVLQRESAGPSRTLKRLRTALVIGQMTCCSVLAISTALLFEGYRSALRTTTSHQLGQPILATVQARSGFARPDLGTAHFDAVERAVQSLPGIFATAWTAALPGSRPSWYDMRVELPRLPWDEVTLDVVTFTPRDAPRIVFPPIAGRMFGGGDVAGGCRVAIVNKEAAALLFASDPVGRSIEDAAGLRTEIIGVVQTRAQPKASPRPTIYYYGEQVGTTADRAQQLAFRVPRISTTPTAVLAGHVVSSSYLHATNMKLAAGTAFGEHPKAPGCRVGVINEEAAELYFGGDAIGGAIIDDAGRRTEIVGVVRSGLLRSTQRREEPTIYFPMHQDFRPRMTLLMATERATGALLASVRRQLGQLSGGDRSALRVMTLDEHLSRTALASERISTLLVGACAAIALALGILGLYGAMLDAVRHRRREIALRLALGAPRWRITHQLFMEGVRLAGIATVIGTIASLFVARWLAATAPRSGALDVTLWLTAPIVLIAAVAIASVLPMRRAMTVNPVALLHRN